jgi:hypothetical protein
LLIEPDDLVDLAPATAVSAVIADIEAHPLRPGPTGLFTATRHIDLTAHLVSRLTGDAQFHLEQAAENPAATSGPADVLAAACAPVTRALAHYGAAFEPLAAMCAPPADQDAHTLLDAIELRSAIHRHLHEARTALDHAHAELTAPSAASARRRSSPAPSIPRPPSNEPPRRTR